MMNQLWYYEDHGRAKGPISTRDLVNKIQKGEMTLMDLVFKEGDPRWLPAESFSELTELIGNISLQESADWIVLKVVNVDGKNLNEQIGPFNAQQILDLLDRGRIRFSDYVWRTGYEKWVPLGRVDEFEKPLKSSVEVDRSLYTKPRHFDLLQDDKKEAPLKKVTKVVVPASTASDEPKPEEARGEDLAAPKWKVQTQVVSRTEVVEPRSKKSAELKSTDAQTPENKEAMDSVPATKAVKSKESSSEKKKNARRDVAETPPLPVTQAKEAQDLPVERFPIFEEPVAAANSPKEKTRVEKLKSKELPPLPSTSSVEKIATGDVEEKIKEKSFEPVEAASTDAEALARKEAANHRWVQVGVAACIVVMILCVSLFAVISKKRTRSTVVGGNFSLKIDPPPANVADAIKPKPTPVVKAPVSEEPIAVVEKPAVKTISKPAPASVAQRKESYDTSPTVGGSSKNRSYYHHKERIYLFYTSNEGEQLATDLQKASQKHQKNAKQWKAFYGGWKGKAKTYSQKVNKEAKKARLHRALFKQLMASAGDLEDLGRDVNAQIADGRGPSKVASAKNLESQFKNIGSNARNLDR